VKQTELRRKTPLRRKSKRKKKSNLQRRKDNPSSNYWKKKADKLWSLCIRECRRCEMCGATNKKLEAHHLIRRDAKKYRHDLDNGICLCVTCHMGAFGQENGDNELISAHGTPWAFEAWMNLHRPKQHTWWLRHRHYVPTGEMNDYKAACERLQATLGAGK